jgi:hypothetical protein
MLQEYTVDIFSYSENVNYNFVGFEGLTAVAFHQNAGGLLQNYVNYKC